MAFLAGVGAALAGAAGTAGTAALGAVQGLGTAAGQAATAIGQGALAAGKAAVKGLGTVGQAAQGVPGVGGPVSQATGALSDIIPVSSGAAAATPATESFSALMSSPLAQEMGVGSGAVFTPTGTQVGQGGLGAVQASAPEFANAVVPEAMQTAKFDFNKLQNLLQKTQQVQDRQQQAPLPPPAAIAGAPIQGGGDLPMSNVDIFGGGLSMEDIEALKRRWRNY